MTQSARDREADSDIANVHLEIQGERHSFAVRVPLGQRRPGELLPAAEEFTHQVTAITIRKARDRGKPISCKAGCGACCRQLVAISVVEAQAIANVVVGLPQNRQCVIRERFASALARLEQAGLLDPRSKRGDRPLVVSSAGDTRTLLHELSKQYFQLQIPCPFLENESCSIHPNRPLVCREYHVVSPAERCAELYKFRVQKVAPPLHMSEILAHVVARIAGVKDRTIALVLALEWMENHGDSLSRTYDGLHMFMDLLGEIDRENQQPFDKRSE
jgi:Fe-S-cluster containining protein